MAHLCLSFRFLSPQYHGRRDGAAPEWPPSPLRALQALLAAAARGCESPAAADLDALRWLERQTPPAIIAPQGVASEKGYRVSVPNNSMDVVARAWSRGADSSVGDANPATHRTMKAVRPIWMQGGDTVHYLWTLDGTVPLSLPPEVTALCVLAGRVSALGWGVDLAVGSGAVIEHDADVPGWRWNPSTSSERGLRVPVPGTLDALLARFGQVRRRVESGTLLPPSPFSTFRLVGYRTSWEPPDRSVTAFSLMRLDTSGFRAFDVVRSGLIVAGMARHAARLAAERSGWEPERIDRLILGHSAEDDGLARGVDAQRLTYVPLPSLEPRGAGGACVAGPVRRLLLMSLGGIGGPDHAWVRRALSGQDLVSRAGDVVAFLSVLPKTDRVVGRYVESAESWATVTPVVLPGYDDPAHYRRRLTNVVSSDDQKHLLGRLSARVERLLRKAISQAGFSRELADHAVLEWRQVGFWPGTDLASRYRVPDHLQRFSRWHVQLSWRDSANRPIPISGPICIGGGRFYGLGLFAPLSR